MVTAYAPARNANDARFIPPHVVPPAAPLPFMRAIGKLMENPIEAWPQAIYEEKYWRPRSFGAPGWRYLYVMDPDGIRDVLLERQNDFFKGHVSRRMLRPALGDGLLTAEGAHWRWQRQAAAPAFRHDRLLQMTHPISRAAERTVETWRKAGPGSRRDIAQDMVRTTFEVILETMLSGGEGLDIEEASREISIYLETLGRPGLLDVIGAPQQVRVLFQPRGARASAYLRAAVSRVIENRRKDPSARGDLIDLLMNAIDPETGRAMEDHDLRDNILTFIAAGHETTALALTWTLYLAAMHPPTTEKLLAEVRAVAGDDPIAPAHIEKLTYAKQVVQESMRLFPPVALIPRTALRDTMVGGETVRAGTTILVPIYALHRHHLLWRDPDAFDPDRFAPGASAGRHRFAYLPFGGGPRICIGMSFAMIEAVTMLATFIRGASFAHDEAHAIRPLVRITMRPEGGMPMVVTPR